MYPSRRSFLLSSAAILICSTPSAAWFHGKYQSGITQFNIGALVGGGYVTGVDVSSDGSTKVLRNDTYGAWFWDSASSSFKQVLDSARLNNSNLVLGGITTQPCIGMNIYEIRIAPSDPQRIYFIGPNQIKNTSASLWRSNDGGQSWTRTAIQDIGASEGNNNGQPSNFTNRLCGYKMAVDPNNADVIYWGDNAGVIYRSLDGGQTHSIVSGALSGLTVTNTSAGTTSSSAVLNFTSTPAIVTGIDKTKYNLYCCDIDNRTALGVISDNTEFKASTSTTVTLWANVSSPGVSTNDQIAFGWSPCIALDPTSGTQSVTDNVIEGGTVTATVTKGIYVAWQYGSTAVFESLDAGGTFTATTSGPTNLQRLKCSNDGVLYACDYDGIINNTGHNAWRYVTPTSTSGLTTSTWTQFGTGNGLLQTAPFYSCAPDNANPGTVVFVSNSGPMAVSENYGTNFYTSPLSAATGGNIKFPTRVSSTVPWMTYTDELVMNAGDICFDPSSANTVIFTEGIGAWTGNPIKQNAATTTTNSKIDNGSGSAGNILTIGAVASSVNIQPGWQVSSTDLMAVTTANIVNQLSGTPGGAGTYTIDGPAQNVSLRNTIVVAMPTVYTEYTRNQNGMIVTDIKKAPGGSLVMACEDRTVLSPASVTTYPTTNFAPFGAQAPINFAYSADYSKSDPTFWMIGVGTSTVYKSTDGGQTWATTTTFVNGGNEPCVAVGFGTGASVNAVVCGELSAGGTPYYTTDSGTTWTPCTLVGGGALPTDGWGAFKGFAYWVAADDTTPGVFYLYNPGHGFYKSVDNGATYTQQCTSSQANFNIKQVGSATLAQVPGFTNVLFRSSGYYTTANGTHPATNFPLICTGDGGQTWAIVTPMDECWLVAFGKPKPGNTVPAMYVAGYKHGDAVPGIFRCDDLTLTPAGGGTYTINSSSLTLTKLTASPAGMIDRLNCMGADPDTYGSLYIGVHGYLYGQLS